MNYGITRELVRKVLEQAMRYQWTLQGFGMLRLNLGKEARIHVWDDRYAVPNVSVIHTHPWDLDSTILSGRLLNVRYLQIPVANSFKSPTHLRQSIATGEGGGLRGEPMPVYLVDQPVEVCLPRSAYHQEADEIHESRPDRGTVTLLQRPKGPPLELAHVYWPHGTNWVSAEPRPATWDEVSTIVGHALERWT